MWMINQFFVILQLLARLGSRPSLQDVDPVLLPEGFLAKDVVELYGDSGSGKTQCLLHWVAKCLLPSSSDEVELGGLSAGVLFIDNDYHFSLIRLVGIMESIITSCFEAANKVAPTESSLEGLIKSCLSRLHLFRCSSSHQFVMTLFSLDSILSHQQDISLLIIDSISSFYWSDRHAGGDSYQQQEKNLVAACSVMNTLRSTHNLCVAASTSLLLQKKGSEGEVLEYSDYLCKPWLKMVNKRLILSQKESQVFEAKCTIESVLMTHLFTIGDLGLNFKS
jgi:DNA-repair protein XRCC2